MDRHGYTGIYNQVYTWICMGIQGYSYVVYIGKQGYIIFGYVGNYMVSKHELLARS